MSETNSFSPFEASRGELTPDIAQARLDCEINATSATESFATQYHDTILPEHVAAWAGAADLLLRHGRPMAIQPIHSSVLPGERVYDMPNYITQYISTGLLAVGEPSIMDTHMATPVMSINASPFNPISRIVNEVRTEKRQVTEAHIPSTLSGFFGARYREAQYVEDKIPYSRGYCDLAHISTSTSAKQVAGFVGRAEHARFARQRSNAVDSLGELIHAMPSMYIWTGFAVSDLDIVNPEARQPYGKHGESGYNPFPGGEKNAELEDVSLRTWAKHVPVLPDGQYLPDGSELPAAFRLPGRNTFKLQPPTVPGYKYAKSRYEMSPEDHDNNVAAQLEYWQEAQEPIGALNKLLGDVNGPLRRHYVFRKMGASAVKLA